MSESTTLGHAVDVQSLQWTMQPASVSIESVSNFQGTGQTAIVTSFTNQDGTAGMLCIDFPLLSGNYQPTIARLLKP